MSDKIKIYSSEKDLADQLSNCTVAYTAKLFCVEKDTTKAWLIKKSADKLKALALKNTSNADIHDSDLYYTKSILVTSNWNKNDDVFDKAEIWAARNTPTHKPTNLEHDEHVLVGHITGNWAVDVNGEILSDSFTIDELPDVFHIVNGAVIYTQWEDEELKQRTKQLISSIEEGKKFVSMECLFTGFDYAIITADDKSHIVARGEDTAWMTKHLRAYGGPGEYRGNRIGRLLRNITFCGKGYVDKPANPDSIIFNSKNMFNFNKASQENPFIINNGVYMSTEAVTSKDENDKEKYMSEDILKTQITKLETALVEAENRAKKAEEQYTQSNVEKLQSANEELTIKCDAQVGEIDALKAKVNELTEAQTNAKSELDEVKETKVKLESELKEVRASETRSSRITDLVDGGIDKESAEGKVDKFVNLNDEQFKIIADELVEVAKIKINAQSQENTEDKGEAEDKDAEASEDDSEQDDAEANEEDLDNAEANEDVDLSKAGESKDEIDIVRKELQAAISSRLGHELDGEEDDSNE